MVSKTNTDYVRFQSWGRTRSPKNILSNHRSGVDKNGAALNLTHGAGNAVSFDTENQRYLHVYISNDGAAGTLKVEGIMWAAATSSGGDGVLDTFNPMPLKTTANGATTALEEGWHLIEIAGIDKVRFEAANNAVEFYAACSTFSK